MVKERNYIIYRLPILTLAFSVIATIVFSSVSQAQSLTYDQMLGQCSSSVAVVLVGDGEGVVTKIAPAIIIKSDGVLLVPYHVIKDAKEVQVRLKSGEIFDDVILLGSDKRRDAAAIKIQTTGLNAIAPTNYDELKVGGSMFVFTHTPGKMWTLTPAKLTGLTLADEIQGAGEGFRVIQFEGMLNAGVDGGILFDPNGKPVGLVTREYTTDQKAGFGVPVDNIKILGNSDKVQSFGSGNALKLPQTEAAFKANKTPNDPLGLLQRSKTIYVETRTTFFKEQQLINELNKRKEIKEWGWVLTTGSWDARNKADLIIELDHQILTFDFTYTVRHRKSSVLISAGKVIIADGASGAPKMVDSIIKSISAIVNPPPPNGK